MALPCLPLVTTSSLGVFDEVNRVPGRSTS